MTRKETDVRLLYPVMFLLLSIVREKHRLDVDELTGVKKGALDRFHTHA